MTKRGPYIFKRAGSWVMRYQEMVNEAGTLKAVQRAKPFCPASIPTKEARSLAKQELQKLEAGRPSKPELIVTLADFVTRVYLPFTFANKRQSTAEGYQDAWTIHFASRPHIARKLLKDVKTSNVRLALRDRGDGPKQERRTAEKANAAISQDLPLGDLHTREVVRLLRWRESRDRRDRSPGSRRRRDVRIFPGRNQHHACRLSGAGADHGCDGRIRGSSTQ